MDPTQKRWYLGISTPNPSCGGHHGLIVEERELRSGWLIEECWWPTMGWEVSFDDPLTLHGTIMFEAGEAAPKRPEMGKVLPKDGFARAWTSLQATPPEMTHQRIKKAKKMATVNIRQDRTTIYWYTQGLDRCKKRLLQQGEDICGNLLQEALMQTAGLFQKETCTVEEIIQDLFPRENEIRTEHTERQEEIMANDDKTGITKEEVSNAIETMKKGKAPSPDGVTTEVVI
ncbi:hypothetical protein HHI36_002541 [Cryptolaemus montrouzieri]|uniref:Uncharacterized protein n=1 Tax=Cryptolaemus montrouzieri TaxID=559131 RepID=A0ABD2PB41_9CUCU